MPGHMSTPPPPPHPESPGVLVTWSVLPFPLKPSSPTSGPSVSDPTVRDEVLCGRKGWQISLNSDWEAVLQLSGLVWGQHPEVEKPVSKNRFRLICHNERGKDTGERAAHQINHSFR